VPNKHDGKTFKRISRHPRAVEIFCGWNLILQVASKMPTRGILFDSDGPLDAMDLADKTNFPVECFEIALEVLVKPEYGWMAAADAPPLLAGEETVSPGDSGSSPGDQARLPGDAGRIIPPAGAEGKGREGKGREGAASALPPPPFQSSDFNKEWEDYIVHRKQMRKPLTKIACIRLFLQFEQWGEAGTIAALKYSMADGRTWQGVFQPPTGAGIQTPMFQDKTETPEGKALRENCARCHGTNTELVAGKGARPCDHLVLEGIE
jgi:hypothetical protein